MQKRRTKTPTSNSTRFWELLYRKYFRLEANFDNLAIPRRQPGFDRLIVVMDSLEVQTVYDAIAKLFTCCRHGIGYEPLDEELATNERSPAEGTYAIWVREVVNANEDISYMSANDLESFHVATETLLERLLHELAYWSETGKHLDNNVNKSFGHLLNNQCAGSRFKNGRVPACHWDSKRGNLTISGISPDFSFHHLGARKVIS